MSRSYLSAGYVNLTLHACSVVTLLIFPSPPKVLLNFNSTSYNACSNNLLYGDFYNNYPIWLSFCNVPLTLFLPLLHIEHCAKSSIVSDSPQQNHAPVTLWSDFWLLPPMNCVYPSYPGKSLSWLRSMSFLETTMIVGILNHLPKILRSNRSFSFFSIPTHLRRRGTLEVLSQGGRDWETLIFDWEQSNVPPFS